MNIVLGVIIIVVGLTLIAAGLWQTFKPKGTDSVVRAPFFTVQGSTGMGIIVLGIACLGGGSYLSSKVSPLQTPVVSPPSPTLTSVPKPTPISSIKDPIATLQYPHNGTNVSRSQGFVARGTSSFLGTTTIWILDHSGGYTVDQEALVSSGSWTATDQPLGDSSNHLPYNLNMVAVFADTTCAHRLTHVNSTPNDYMNHLPAGCTIFDQVTVNVSRR